MAYRTLALNSGFLHRGPRTLRVCSFVEQARVLLLTGSIQSHASCNFASSTLRHKEQVTELPLSGEMMKRGALIATLLARAAADCTIDDTTPVTIIAGASHAGADTLHDSFTKGLGLARTKAQRGPPF